MKFGVQFGLFGGSILFLGTRDHHLKYLPDTARLDLLGCYAMTEMGRGSNLRDLETTAHYERKSQELIIHTPTESARKEWIGNAGHYARMATVYAQLITSDPYSNRTEEHGVHAFLIPIRDDDGQPMPGGWNPPDNPPRRVSSVGRKALASRDDESSPSKSNAFRNYSPAHERTFPHPQAARRPATALLRPAETFLIPGKGNSLHRHNMIGLPRIITGSRRLLSEHPNRFR